MIRIKDAEEAQKIFARYEELMKKINEFKRKYFHDWAQNIAKVINEKINNTILARQGSDLILNYSPIVSIFCNLNHIMG